jgi:uncharacterized coiled-coil protein SlyX
MEQEIEFRFKKLETKIRELEDQIQNLNKKVKPEELNRVFAENLRNERIRQGIRSH